MSGVGTAIVVTSIGFLIGASFTHWSVDHRTLWTQPITDSAVSHSLAYYSDLVEAPVWVMIGVYSPAMLAALTLGFKMIGAGMGAVFDGASFVLLSVATITHVGHITGLFHNLPVPYSLPDTPTPLPSSTLRQLQDIASSHTVVSVALTGMIALQAAGWYVERSVRKAEEKRRAERRERRRSSSAHSTGSANGRRRIMVDGAPTTRIEAPQTPIAASPPGSAGQTSSPTKRRSKKRKE